MSVSRPSALLALLALLATGLLWTSPAAAQETNQLDVMIVVDNSTSMCCPPIENDADEDRIQFARLFVNLLGVDQLETDYRLGFVFFGTDASLIAPLSPIAENAERDALLSAVGLDEDAPDMGWTDVRRALNVARDELNRNGRPGAKQAVVLLTDGEPRLPDWPNEGFDDQQSAYMADLRTYIQNNWGDDVPLFTVAFSEEAFRQDPDNQVYKNLFEELAVITGAPADVGYQEAVTDEDLGQVYFNIVRSLLGLETGVELPPPEQVPVVKEFAIDSELAQVIFVVLKDNPNITTTVRDPSGNVVPCPLAADVDSDIVCERSEREESISIRSPERGTWRVSLDGQGFIQFQPVPFPLDQEYAFELLSPLRGHPAGKPLMLMAQVLERETGEVVAVENPTVVVEYPSGAQTEPLALVPTGDGRYAATVDDSRESGDYILRFTGDVAEGTLHGDGSVQVLSAPWVRIDSPVGSGFPANQPIDVLTQLMWLDKPLPQVDQTWSLIASANLYGAGDQLLSSASLQPEASGIFRGQIEPDGAEGERIIEVSLVIETESGERFTDQTRGVFVVGPAVLPTDTATPAPTVTPAPTATPGPTPTPTPPPEPPNAMAVVGGGGLVLLLVGAVAGGVLYARRPKLSGEINVEGGSGGYYILKGSKPFTVGSDPKSKIALHGDRVAARHAELRPHGRSVELVNLAAGGGLDEEGFGYAPLEVKGKEERSYQEVSSIHTLQDGDTIRIGDNLLVYSNVAQSGGFEDLADDGGDDFHFDEDV